MNANYSPDAIRRRAKKIGIVTGVVALVVILGGVAAAMAMGYGAPRGGGDDYKRGQALGTGALLLSFWIGLIGWGVARVVLRRKSGQPTE